MKRRLTVLFVLFILAVCGNAAANWFMKKIHIDFTDIFKNFDDELL